jgi:hypothetical protein
MARAPADKKDIGFDAVMAMAISLSQPPELKPLVVFTPAIPEGRMQRSFCQFCAIFITTVLASGRIVGFSYTCHLRIPSRTNGMPDFL